MCCAGQVDSGQAQRSVLFAWLLGAVLAFGALTIVAQGRLDRTTASVEDGAKDLADLFEDIDGLSDDLLAYANDASAAAARAARAGRTAARPLRCAGLGGCLLCLSPTRALQRIQDNYRWWSRSSFFLLPKINENTI